MMTLLKVFTYWNAFSWFNRVEFVTEVIFYTTYFLRDNNTKTILSDAVSRYVAYGGKLYFYNSPTIGDLNVGTSIEATSFFTSD